MLSLEEYRHKPIDWVAKELGFGPVPADTGLAMQVLLGEDAGERLLLLVDGYGNVHQLRAAGGEGKGCKLNIQNLPKKRPDTLEYLVAEPGWSIVYTGEEGSALKLELAVLRSEHRHLERKLFELEEVKFDRLAEFHRVHSRIETLQKKLKKDVP